MLKICVPLSLLKNLKKKITPLVSVTKDKLRAKLSYTSGDAFDTLKRFPAFPMRASLISLIPVPMLYLGMAAVP